ncbi:hypothetical protein [Nocardia sp. NBC_01327]|uniref:hypothetical protein n=1 Tax=Nocardia sp. NBC_01327 TaxID=2903593 RepID=UPI002E0F24C1|nr:hypothetical protein OG326_30940 [Nocardia sp. NBC_01327]
MKLGGTAWQDLPLWTRIALRVCGTAVIAVITGLIAFVIIPDSGVHMADARVGECIDIADKLVASCSDSRTLYQVTAVLGPGQDSKCPALDTTALGKVASFEEIDSKTLCLAMVIR